jgi:glutaredoxin 3
MNVMDLDLLDSDGPLIQMELLMKTKQRTVPNIYIGGKHIGGSSDLQELFQNGQLEKMLEQSVKKRKTATA